MKLGRSDEQVLLEASFERLLARESSCERVRAAEPGGFDPALWRALVGAGAPCMLLSVASGGAGASLLDALLLAGQAGRHLVSAPLVESVVATALLEDIALPVAEQTLAAALRGDALVTFCPALAHPQDPRLVPGGAVADAVLGLDGADLVLVQPGGCAALANLGRVPLARLSLREGAGAAARHVLATGSAAQDLHARANEVWKLLTAAALCGLGRRSLELAAAYATQRVQFDRPIGSFQGVAHPLADALAALEGGEALLLETVDAIGKRAPDAAALVSMCFAWSSRAATEAAGRALHTFGGSGLSLEHDIQLYFRRCKSWAQLAGNPDDELLRVARRLWDAERTALPDAGEVAIDFSLGAAAAAAGREAAAFFEANLDDALRAQAQPGFAGHDPSMHRRLAAAGLLFPGWPEAQGGGGRGPYAVRAIEEEFMRAGWTTFPIQTTRMVAETLMHFGSEALTREVLPRVAAGEAIISLGYTEPGAGSDVAAVRTRAERHGQGWRINGQKLFTSGAEVADYVFLLTRSDPDAPRHRGLTMFLVPLDSPGVEIQPIHTLSDERTNATYYSDVELPDRYRVGDVDGGWRVLSYALALEHSGSGANFNFDHGRLVARAADWALARDAAGRRRFDDPRIVERLGLAATRARVGRALGRKSLWAAAEGEADRALGPMEKLFCSEAFVRDATDLLDLAAPDSLLECEAAGVLDGAIEFGYRLSAATTLYGGSSEIMRSIVAQVGLGMPRSRS